MISMSPSLLALRRSLAPARLWSSRESGPKELHPFDQSPASGVEARLALRKRALWVLRSTPGVTCVLVGTVSLHT